MTIIDNRIVSVINILILSIIIIITVFMIIIIMYFMLLMLMIIDINIINLHCFQYLDIIHLRTHCSGINNCLRCFS